MPLNTNGTEITMHVTTIDQTPTSVQLRVNGIGELGDEADRERDAEQQREHPEAAA